jgi:CoA:oxalate CoA-transferase
MCHCRDDRHCPSSDHNVGVTSQGPLAGIRVLDFTRVLAGPHCTRALCDLGAEVIKAEPPDGDLPRYTYPRVNSLATYFVQQNVGKQSISLDMGNPESVELLRRLADQCDVVIENFRPGVMDRMGIGYETLGARNPRLVYASITGYGQTGPWAQRRAYASVIGAESGFTKAQGDAQGGEYSNDAHSHADVYTALEATIAILAALHQRHESGRGQRLDIAMASTMLYVNEHAHAHLWDEPIPEGQLWSFQPGDYPMLTLADGASVVISGHPADRSIFEGFAAATESPDLLDDPRFATIATRLTHLDELRDEFRQRAATVPNATIFEERLEVAGLAMGVLRSVADICATDWAAERGAVVDVSDRGDGVIRLPNSPWRFSDADAGLDPAAVARYRGENNRDVLRDVLGLDDGELDRLEAVGVLSSRVPRPAK